MIILKQENQHKDFSEPKPFKRSAELKTRVWSPLSLFKMRGLFSGVLLLVIGIFYFIWALVKENLIINAVWIFWIPGIYITLLALRKKAQKTE